MAIASLRALACYEEDECVRCNDHMAELFLPADKKASLVSKGIRDMIKKAIPEGLYEYVIARTRYFDELFSSVLEQGIPQVVLMGAGYDSRPYRFRDIIGETLVYEVDHPATQEYKRSILQNNEISVHRNVRYVALNFEEDDLNEALNRAGYDSVLQTLFIWEGVTFYLNPDTVDRVLRILKSSSGPGSMLGFDYQTIKNGSGLIDTGLRTEVIRFGIEEGTVEGYLKRFNYSVIEHINSEEMCKRYLTRTNGSRLGVIAPIMNIILAAISEKRMKEYVSKDE